MNTSIKSHLLKELLIHQGRISVLLSALIDENPLQVMEVYNSLFPQDAANIKELFIFNEFKRNPSRIKLVKSVREKFHFKYLRDAIDFVDTTMAKVGYTKVDRTETLNMSTYIKHI